MIDKRRTRDGEVRYEVRLRSTDGKERSRTFRTKKEADIEPPKVIPLAAAAGSSRDRRSPRSGRNPRHPA